MPALRAMIRSLQVQHDMTSYGVMRTAEGQMWLYRQKVNRLLGPLHDAMIGMRYTAANLSAIEIRLSQLQAPTRDMALVVMCTAWVFGGYDNDKHQISIVALRSHERKLSSVLPELSHLLRV